MGIARALPLSSSSLAWIPPGRPSHEELAAAAQRCQGCDLYRQATQAVFGEGPVSASMMLVGEQPGDHEDLEGRPFVGPAGRFLDEALALAGISRERVYLTNAVKHFKWEPRGKRRLHSKPNAAEVHACRGFLDAELALVRPHVVVCLGATAAQLFLGRAFRITQRRGELIEAAPLGQPWSRWISFLLATYHPSALLRMRGLNKNEYELQRRAFVSDLRAALSAPVKVHRVSSRQDRRVG
jgi:uracil-DNA glycosylase